MADASESDSEDTRERENPDSDAASSDAWSDRTDDDGRAVAAMEQFLGVDEGASTCDPASASASAPAVSAGGIEGY